jgi:hypothetical protein
LPNNNPNVAVQEVRWDGGGNEPAGEYIFLVMILELEQ